MNWFTSSIGKEAKPSSKNSKNGRNTNDQIVILDKIGSGSYGTVHYCQFDEENSTNFYVAKRAWTFNELVDKQSEAQDKSNYGEEDKDAKIAKKKKDKDEQKKLKERAKRCQHYLTVEEHCLEKIKKANAKLDEDGSDSDSDSAGNKKQLLPNCIGRFVDNTDGNEWLVFDLIVKKQTQNNDDSNPDTSTSMTTPPQAAKSLHNAMFLDWKDQHKPGDVRHHHLYMIQKALGMDKSDNDDGEECTTTFEDTLDVILKSLLEVLVATHEQNIVHRDVKPDNLLIDGNTQSLVLIDFGSAADMDPSQSITSYGKRVGLDENVVAVSPIYAAPETFIKLGKDVLTFDVFSAGLIFCQLLFNLLDERTDAAFRQQLDEANFDLDVWLERELQATIRPAGFDDGMQYLADRVGMWQLLKEMLAVDPFRRIHSPNALKRYKKVLATLENDEIPSREEIDGTYFDSVVSSLELCTVPIDDEMGYEVSGSSSAPNTMEESNNEFVVPRPLHFIATFKRGKSLGLILSESQTDDEDEDDEDLKSTKEEWKIATEGANKGEVFVRHVVEGGQADEMGIIEIGDRLVGVGDFPFFNDGFGGFLQMLEKVPGRAKNVKIHFDRQSILLQNSDEKTLAVGNVSITSQGAWSTKGRRKSNEDTFILQEIHDDEMHSVLIAGIFDGHGGDSASKTSSQILPSLLSTELSSEKLPKALQSAWDTTCDTYQDGCSIYGECVAEYDPREGVLLAGTGAKDLIAGTTASVAALSMDSDNDELVVLNCGDSRTLLVGEPKDESLKTCIHFVTKDHSPRCNSEAERLQAGIDKGLDYSLPQCSVNRWWLKVGDYNYAVSRSLEGQFATSKGIVSEADISTVSLGALTEQRNNSMMIIASDGLFEVLDNELVGREALKMRREGLSAKDTAKQLCALALNKNTSDNVSAVVVFFE